MLTIRKPINNEKKQTENGNLLLESLYNKLKASKKPWLRNNVNEIPMKSRNS